MAAIGLNQNIKRTVHPFATAPYVLRISGRSEKLGFLNGGHFWAVYNYAGKAEFCKGYWDLKRKLGVTTHFSEIIKLQFGKKKCHTLRCILGLFRINVA